MIKIVLVLLYIWSGDIVLEQRAFKSEAECHAAGGRMIQEQQKDPRFEGGLFAGCIKIKVQEANAK